MEILDEETIEEEKHNLLVNPPIKLIKQLKNIVIEFYKSLTMKSQNNISNAPNSRSNSPEKINPNRDIEGASISTSDENDPPMNEYERLLITAEAENRAHIAVEQQMKMKIDDYEMRVSELETQLEEINVRLNNTEKELSKYTSKSNEKENTKDNEINKLKSDIGQTRQLLKSYEDQSLKMTDLEKKLRNIKNIHEKDLKMIEEKYKEVIFFIIYIKTYSQIFRK